MDARRLKKILKRSGAPGFEEDASSLGGAIAVFTLFSIAPILLIVVWIASAFISADAVQSHILVQMRLLLGRTGAEAIQTLMVSAKYSGTNALSKTAGIVALLVGAT